MKNIKKLLLMMNILCLVFLASSPIFADGTKGGQIISGGGSKRLRDLVDKSICEWVPTSSFTDQIPGFKTLIASIEQKHWYLAHVLTQETKRTSICKVEGKLMSISSEDLDALTYYSLPGSISQMAIRHDSDIYLSMPEFRDLASLDQPFAITHELMHALIPENEPMRNTKVKSMVYTLSKNVTTETLIYQMKKNNLQITGDLSDLDDYRSAINEMTDIKLSFSQRQEAAKRLRPIEEQLYVGDRDLLKELIFYTNETEIREKILKSLEKGKFELFEKYAYNYPTAKFYFYPNERNIDPSVRTYYGNPRSDSNAWDDCTLNVSAIAFLKAKKDKNFEKLGLQLLSTSADYQSALVAAIISDLPEIVRSIYISKNLPLNAALMPSCWNKNTSGVALAAFYQSPKVFDLFASQKDIQLSNPEILTKALENLSDGGQATLNFFNKVLQIAPSIDYQNLARVININLYNYNSDPELNRKAIMLICKKQNLSSSECANFYRRK